MKNKFMSKFFNVLFLVIIVVGLASCNVTNKMGDNNTPFPTRPTTIEFWSGGAKIAEYENACVHVLSVLNSRLVGASITWYYYEIEVDGVIVDTIIDSEALTIKYKGRRVR